MVNNEIVDSIVKYAKKHGITAKELKEISETHWQSFPEESQQRYIGFLYQVEGCYDKAEIEAAAALLD